MIHLLAAAAAAVVAPAPSPTAAIEAAMKDSAAGWDSGDLARFVAVYAPDAIFVGRDGVVRGKEAIAARYARSFAGGGNTRGKLTFEPVAWRTLSAVHMLFVARWTLTPPDGKPQSGMTSLLFERRKDGWRIISDHSS
ncbi:MAG: SgcJ/EcaC family oxidoreductase [Sphingomonas adhaesiva]|uniref:YybH family protein n=1 Tax=Sphingomonas adhaesiva TaxID=28212 RepID=UPI002FF84837